MRKKAMNWFMGTMVCLGFGTESGYCQTPVLGDPLPGLVQTELNRFGLGQSMFTHVVTRPEGLGPVFNGTSCVGCHGGTTGPIGGGSARVGTRFGRITLGQFDPMVEFGGSLIQDKGIGIFGPVNFVGETVPPQATIVAARKTTPLFGLGLVDAVADATFVQLAQHQSAATPFTAGRPAFVNDPVTGQLVVGKFGWKAQQPNLFAFSADALLNELGITTPIFPVENSPQGNSQLLLYNPALTSPNALTADIVHELTDFMSLLAPPAPAPLTSDAVAGQFLFGSIGCADCHQPTLQTGFNAVASLNQVTFAPYSDFLLHDMGTLGDGIPQANAGRTEMRTAPLWGLRFQKGLLHDNRAKTPTDAILAHDGQGAISRANFNKLNATQRKQLLAFLNSL